MELINRAEVYKQIESLEKLYENSIEISERTGDSTFVSLFKRFLKDLTLLKKTIEKIPAPITLNDSFFSNSYISSPKEIREGIKKHQELRKELPYDCIECGAPTKYPFGICAACAKKAGKQRKAYDKYVKEQKEKYEK